MHILTPALMKAEMEKYPDFAWPKDCVKEMMEDKELLVLEMKGLSVGVFFAKGYEIKVPLPLGCAVEIGHDQSKAVEALFRDAGAGEVRTVKDLSTYDRVVVGVKNPLETGA